MTKVLVIDDDVETRILIEAIFSTVGVKVIQANDGKSGIELARHHKPQVIFMDIRLPGMDGFQTTETIRAIPELAGIPIVLLTATFLNRQEIYKSAIFDAYFEKPFRPSELRKYVQDMLG
jgi:CheY-like chemotaxis protein